MARISFSIFPLPPLFVLAQTKRHHRFLLLHFFT
jgi:hypothetical protein